MILTTIYSALFFDVDRPKSYSLNRAAVAVAQQLGSVVNSAVKTDLNNGILAGVLNNFRPHDSALREFGTASVRRCNPSWLWFVVTVTTLLTTTLAT